MLISLNNGEIIIDNNFIDGIINRNRNQYFIKEKFLILMVKVN